MARPGKSGDEISRIGTFFPFKQSANVPPDEGGGGGGVVPVQDPNPDWQPEPQYAAVEPLYGGSKMRRQKENTEGTKYSPVPKLTATVSILGTLTSILIVSPAGGIRRHSTLDQRLSTLLFGFGERDAPSHGCQCKCTQDQGDGRHDGLSDGVIEWLAD